MRKLKIGFLIPYSGVYPNLKEDFIQGLQLALTTAQLDTMSFFQEFINMGDLKRVRDTLDKLIRFERTDMIIGVVNSSVIAQCAEHYVPYKVPVLINNLGARIPYAGFGNPYLYYNSLHLWKSEWTMGRWAQTKFGGLPSINMSLYESGYSLHECFKTGTAAAGAEQVILNVLKPLTPDTCDTTPLINYLSEQLPAHAHILLSGRESGHFLACFRESGLHERIALSVSPFMVEEELIPDFSLTENIYSATTWSADLDTPDNHTFVAAYTERYGEKPKTFSLLGYESGMALAAALEEGSDLKDFSGNVKASGPRGTVHINSNPVAAPQPVYIRQAIRTGDIVKNCIISTEDGVSWTDPGLSAGSAMTVSGWENPYLCV